MSRTQLSKIRRVLPMKSYGTFTVFLSKSKIMSGEFSSSCIFVLKNDRYYYTRNCTKI